MSLFCQYTCHCNHESDTTNRQTFKSKFGACTQGDYKEVGGGGGNFMAQYKVEDNHFDSDASFFL